MRLPKFHKVPFAVPVIVACSLQDEVKKVKGELRKLYSALGGDPAAECCKKAEITGLKEGIKAIVDSHMNKVLEDLWQQNPFLKEHIAKEEAFGVENGIKYQFFSSKKQKPQLLVRIELWLICVMYAKFVARMEKERPRVYPLFRKILRLVDYNCGVNSTPWEYENLLERLEMDREDGEEVDDELYQEAEREIEEYKRHLQFKGSCGKRALREIKLLHKEVAWELSEDENWFVITAIQLFDSWFKWEWNDIGAQDDLDEWYGDRHDLSRFFNLLWDPGGIASNEMENFFQWSGEQSAPAITMVVSDKKSLKKTAETVKSLILLEGLFAGGFDIWNSAK